MSYYTNLIPDFGLSAEQLDDKYNQDGDGEHPDRVLSRMRWREAVANGDTISGYWDWIEHRLSEFEDELDRDNPYNQPWTED